MISVISGIATMRDNKESNQRVIDNFRCFQECFFNQSLEDKELVLIEQRRDGQTESPFDGIIDERARHAIVYGYPFGSGWLLNVGAQMADGEILDFIDADVCFDETYLADVADAMEQQEHPYLHGYNLSYWLNEAGRKRYIDEGVGDVVSVATGEYEDLLDRVILPDVIGNIGLSVICRRDYYFDVVGGHNESFIAGGGRDNDFTFRVVREAGGFPILQRPLVHLYHGGKIMGGNSALWGFTQKHPDLVTLEIKQLGVGHLSGPRRHTLEEWEKLATQYEAYKQVKDEVSASLNNA